MGGRLQVPAGAKRGPERDAPAVKAVNDTRSKTNAALTIPRVERCVNIAVPFIEGLLGQNKISDRLFLRNTVHLLVSYNLAGSNAVRLSNRREPNDAEKKQ